MATEADFIADVLAGVAALTSAPSRLGSDRVTNLAEIPAGSARFQLATDRVGVSRIVNANDEYVIVLARVAVHHKLADATDERVYTEGLMLTHQASLLDSEWWRGFASVYELDNDTDPRIEAVSDRDGNIITYTLACQVRLVP